MDCKEFRESLDLYVDHELSGDGMAVAEQHVRECGPCRHVERDLRRLRVALKTEVNRHELPPDLIHRVRSQFQPSWRAALGMRPSQAALDSTDQVLHARSFALLWKKRVSLPAPIFAALLVVTLAVVSWSVFHRTNGQVMDPKPGPIRARLTSQPGDGRQREIDLSRFDRGDRAAIVKIRHTEEAPYER